MRERELLPDIAIRPDWQHADAPPEAWRPAIEAICQRHGLPTDALSLVARATFVVFLAGPHHVIKLMTPRDQDQRALELAVQERIAGQLPVATPVPEHVGELAGWPYMVMSRVPGQGLGKIWPELPLADRLRLARGMGELAVALHAVPTHGLEAHAVDWASFVHDQVTNIVAHHRRAGATEPWLEQLEPFLTAAGTPPPPERLVLLHTELIREHLHVEQRDGRWELVGLVDLADAMLGHHEYEFAAPVEFIFQQQTDCLVECLRGYGYDQADIAPPLLGRIFQWHLLHRYSVLPRLLDQLGAREATRLEQVREIGFAPEPGFFDPLLEPALEP